MLPTSLPRKPPSQTQLRLQSVSQKGQRAMASLLYSAASLTPFLDMAYKPRQTTNPPRERKLRNYGIYIHSHIYVYVHTIPCTQYTYVYTCRYVSVYVCVSTHTHYTGRRTNAGRHSKHMNLSTHERRGQQVMIFLF
jgi:hypothetical protein